jgi:hypothetical protein
MPLPNLKGGSSQQTSIRAKGEKNQLERHGQKGQSGKQDFLENQELKTSQS